MSFAAKHLTLGGRLVFWMPFYRADYKESMVPRHDCLSLLANSEQVLSTYVCRRLLTYEKVVEPGQSTASEEETTAAQYEFDFRERYFRPTELSRKERRQLKFDANLAKRPTAEADTATGQPPVADNL